MDYKDIISVLPFIAPIVVTLVTVYITKLLKDKKDTIWIELLKSNKNIEKWAQS